MSWTKGYDDYGREYQERDDGYREYVIDKDIAQLIWNKHVGIGCNIHTYRALSIAVTGFDCQMTGQDLVKAAVRALDKEGEYYGQST